MRWFKILLLCLMGLGVIMNLMEVGKGEFAKTNKPIVGAISAVMQLLFFLGILVYL